MADWDSEDAHTSTVGKYQEFNVQQRSIIKLVNEIKTQEIPITSHAMVMQGNAKLSDRTIL